MVDEQGGYTCKTCSVKGREKGLTTLERLAGLEEALQAEVNLRVKLQEKLDDLGEVFRQEQKKKHDLVDKVKLMEEELAKLREDKARAKEMVQATVRKETATFAEKLKKNLDATPGHVIQKEVADLQDRRLNVIFRGIRESAAKEKEDRQNHDLARIEDVAEKAGIKKEDFKRVQVSARRLGKWEEGKTHRPILVRLTSTEVRENLLRGNKLLKEANKKAKDIGTDTRHRIDPDLTREQVANLDKAWEEARKRTQDSKNGTKFFVVGKENPIIRSEKLPLQPEQ